MKIHELMESTERSLVGLTIDGVTFPQHTLGTSLRVPNMKLTSLEGSPSNIVGDFTCDDNLLSSLEGGPKTVLGHYRCAGNALVTLKGGPTFVRDTFNCRENSLVSLEGAVDEVAGFNCHSNLLTSLKGGPSSITGGDFVCDHNNIEIIEGAPGEMFGGFSCTYNNLTTLHDVHRHIKRCTGIFNVSSNRIASCVLGLLLIEGLRRIIAFASRDTDVEDASTIVNAYLKTGSKYDGGSRGRIVDCQNELIEANLEDFAKL